MAVVINEFEVIPGEQPPPLPENAPCRARKTPLHRRRSMRSRTWWRISTNVSGGYGRTEHVKRNA